MAGGSAPRPRPLPTPTPIPMFINARLAKAFTPFLRVGGVGVGLAWQLDAVRRLISACVLCPQHQLLCQ